MNFTKAIDPADICVGEETTVVATPTGGSGIYSYSWTSFPEGFTSDEQSPMVNPLENTQYFVAVDDGIIVLTDNIEIVVNALPEVNLGDDQILCGETEYTLDAGNEGATYLWSTGEDTQTIIANGSGPADFWVDVTNISGCTTRDEIMITFANIPEVNLGADTTLCGNSNIILDAGNEGAEYLWSNGEETQIITVDTVGYGYGIQSLSVLVTNEYGCESESKIEVEFLDCTGINESKATVSIVAYPNPSSGIINLKLESVNNEIIEIKISGINGNVIYFEENVSINKSLNKQIDLRNFANGVYTLFVIGENYIVDEKIILQQ